MSSVNWADLVNSVPNIDKYIESAKPKPKVPVSTWTQHKCDSKHRTADTFLQCAIGKKWINNGMNWHHPSVRVNGTGLWAVMKSYYSGSYYSKHNNSTQNYGHFIYNVKLFDEYEEASQYFMKIKENCYDDGCNGSICRDLEKKIVKIVL